METREANVFLALDQSRNRQSTVLGQSFFKTLSLNGLPRRLGRSIVISDIGSAEGW